MKIIYTITCFTVVGLHVQRRESLRCWGWFETLEEAKRELSPAENKSIDLYFENGTFNYAVIEEVPPGIMGRLDIRKTWWYKVLEYDCDNDRYTISEIAEPEFAKGGACWSMG